MADQKKRIIDLSELSQEVQEGQYILVDSAGGTGKMNLKKIVDDSTTSLTERVTDLETDLTEEENARSAADTELSGRISDLQTALAAEKQAREEADEDIETALDNKAEKDGYYPSLYAGNLTSTRKQTDSVPYLMRKTGGDLSRIGEREDDTLVGATVNVNQLINLTDNTRTVNGITIKRQNGIEVVYSGTATATANRYVDAFAYVSSESFMNNFIVGHKYVLSSKSSDNNLYLVINNPYTDLFSSDTKEVIYSPTANPTYFYTRITVTNGPAVSGSGRVQIIDLTKKFGSTIADYLYSLETATAGAGIAKLREWGFLTCEYIPYNAGSLESVEATAHIMRDADENIIGNYSLGTDTLRGLFKLDSNNNLYADGDTKTSDGTVTRKYGIRAYQSGDESLADAITDGTNTVYKLTTPTTEQSTSFQNPQICDPDGTEEYVTSNGVPVGHETEYDYDIKGLAEELIDVPDVPSSNGTYVLKATRTADGLSYNWVTG